MFIDDTDIIFTMKSHIRNRNKLITTF